MAEYRTVKSRELWGAPYFEGLQAKAKLFYLYLITGPLTNNLGVINATTSRVAFETALQIDEVEELLQKFEADKKIICDRDLNLTFVKNFIKHQTAISPKMITGLKNLAKEVKSSIILTALIRQYPDIFKGLRYPLDTPSIPPAELEREREYGNRKLETPPTPPLGGCPGEPESDFELTLPESQPAETEARAKAAKLFPAILALYRETLAKEAWAELIPMNKRERHTGAVVHSILADPVRADIEFWRGHVNRIRGSGFHMGRTPDRNGEYFKSRNFDYFIALKTVDAVAGWVEAPAAKQDTLKGKDYGPAIASL
jgi:uncharacterized protein YsxB (DUF464 family)